MAHQEKEKQTELIERLVKVRRVAKVVKGGRRFGFSALVVVGDGNGRLGFALGKANEVTEAVKKAGEKAKKRLKKYALYNNRTVFHPLSVKYGGSRLMIKPAAPGSGIISSGPIRAVMEAIGIKDINIKALGSTEPTNLVLATVKGLSSYVSFEAVAEIRGKETEEIKLIPY